MNLCIRCFVKQHPELKKKQIKQLMSTTEKFKCDLCKEYKALVIEPRKKEIWEEEDEF